MGRPAARAEALEAEAAAPRDAPTRLATAPLPASQALPDARLAPPATAYATRDAAHVPGDAEEAGAAVVLHEGILQRAGAGVAPHWPTSLHA